jgi:hypothetical protein
LGGGVGGYIALIFGPVVGVIRLSSSACFATAIGDIDWSRVEITQIKWERVNALGDEYYVDSGDVVALSEVAKLYRALAQRLRQAGFITAADQLTYRSLIVQRKITLRESGLVPFLGSYVLDVLSGYGYRLGNIFVVYGLVLAIFAGIFWALGVHSFASAAAEPWYQSFWDSFLVSLSAIHGRATFEQLGAWTPAAWVAAVESVVGIVIEGVFVAMIIQRLFR